MNTINYKDNAYINEKWIPAMERMLELVLSGQDPRLIKEGLEYSIAKRLTRTYPANIKNEYNNTNIQTNNLDLINFIETKKPILTPGGTMFTKHGVVPNLISEMLTKFLDTRKGYKAERKKYDKGTKEFAFYNLMQLVTKIIANSLYGAQGMCNCIFYNYHVASSITSSGQSLISASGLFFEMFLHNNVKYESLNEMIAMIDNIKNEKRIYDDNEILDRDITIDECFEKVIMTCGFDWIPTEREMNIIYKIINELSIQDRNRLFYKNCLYDFIDNKYITKLLYDILNIVENPMIFPTAPPEEAKENIIKFKDLLLEYVYYGHQITNRLDKYSSMYRSVSIITDTDSVIISLDNWYRYILDKFKDNDFPLNCNIVDEVSALEGNPKITKTFKHTDNSVEAVKEAKYLKPGSIPPQEGLRYTIINIMAYCLDDFVNRYMVNYVDNLNGLLPDGSCLLILKNEFLMKNALVRGVKKSYASLLELQEGTVVPKDQSLDLKNLIDKSEYNPDTRNRLSHILKEFVLDIDDGQIDQARIIYELKLFEDEIFQSLRKGDKKYYKPVVIKPRSSYEDPLRMSGIKASIVFNEIRGENVEAIDLDDRNTIDIVKVNINKKNVDRIEDKNVVEKLKKLLEMKVFKNGITTIGVPPDETLPEYIIPFIDYKKIISDNIKPFPIEDIGISRGRKINPYTNIISF